MPKYVQDFLPGFLEADAEARESLISETERQHHLTRQLCKYSKMQKLCKNQFMGRMIEKAKRDLINLMERQHV